jgi:hypothetical protein
MKRPPDDRSGDLFGEGDTDPYVHEPVLNDCPPPPPKQPPRPPAMDETPERGPAIAPEYRLIAEHPESFPDDFAPWLADNWHVWREFQRQAHWLRINGRRKHFAARTIGEYMRHYTALSETEGMWKLNDHRWPDLARLYMLKYPEAAGFFELRVQAGSSKRQA